MNRIIILSFITLLCSMNSVYAQRVYIDPTTTAALAIYANQIENAQEETIEEQTRLQQAQMWVGAKMAAVENIQKKVYRGLSEVSGTLTNGVQVMRIYENLERCSLYAGQISDFAAEHPEFTVFAVKTTQQAYQNILVYSNDITSILTAGDTNLATAGDRYLLLEEVNDAVSKIKISLLQILMKMEAAERVGFLNALNPFQEYINTDKDIVENILDRWQNF